MMNDNAHGARLLCWLLADVLTGGLGGG